MTPAEQTVDDARKRRDAAMLALFEAQRELKNAQLDLSTAMAALRNEERKK